MSRTAFRLPFRLLGIPIEIDLSLLMVLPLMAWLIGSDVLMFAKLFGLPSDSPLWQGSTPFLLGLLCASGLFASVLIHELGHSLVGRRYGAKTQKITLWLLGGVAYSDEIPRARGAEAVMAIAGPITSILIAGLLWLLRQAVPDSWVATQFVLGYLMLVNLMLALFNLLPALPLDGGRVLRSLLALAMPYTRATQIAAQVSTLLAFLLGLWGFMTFNVWLMLIAFFVYSAGTSEAQYAAISESLKGFRVRDLMTPEVEVIPPQMTAGELLQKMAAERHTCYPVIDLYGKLLGLVHLQQLHGALPDQPARDFMQSPAPTIGPEASALEALKQISLSPLGRLVVLDAERIVGILSRSDLLRAIEFQTVERDLRRNSPPQR